MSHDAASWRARFPILEDATYLVSHSLGAVPAATRDALDEYYRTWAAQGIQAWEGPWWGLVEEWPRMVESLLHAPAGTVVPMQNATRAMAAVASCFEYAPARNRVVMTELEFTTHYPFWRNQERLGAQVTIVPSPDGVTVPTQDLIRAIDDRTLLVPTCDVYFRSAARQDLRAVTEAAHAHGALVLADGYQAAGNVPVDVQRLGVDFYVGGSHKWLCGGAGAGYLYVRKDLIADLEPRLTGWFGLPDPFAYAKELDASARHPGVFRFLDGTPNVPALYAAREGLRNVLEVGVDAIHRHTQALAGALVEGADARGITVHSPRDPARRSSMTCLRFDGDEAATGALAARRVLVDWRPECGMRVSPHYYTTREDVDAFFDALDAVRQSVPSPTRA